MNNSFSTVEVKHTKDDHAISALSHRFGMSRILHYPNGLYECQAGDFLFGQLGRVEQITAFGPVDDFGNIVNLADLDTVEVSLT